MTIQLFGDEAERPPREVVDALGALCAEGRLKPDSYATGGSVARLERAVARALGKPAAVFLPTGTLANLLALRALCGARRKVVVPAESHFARDAGDGGAQLAGLSSLALAPGRPLFSAAELAAELARAGDGRVRREVGAVLVETPVRRLHNRAPSLAELAAISRLCRRQRVGLHLDGARLFIAAAAQGVAPRRYAALFDTVYVSLYKYFGARAGAVLAGPRSLLRGLRDDRRMFGGSPSECYMDAALAERGLEAFPSRVPPALALGRDFWRRLRRRAGAALRIYPDGTNVAFLRVPPRARRGLRREPRPGRRRARPLRRPPRRLRADRQPDHRPPGPGGARRGFRAGAAPMKGRLLETLSWLEAERALRKYPVAMIPLGARTKEHGPHLPLNNDWIMAEYLARRVMARAPVLTLPTIPYGYYPAFVEYPGSVHVGLAASRDTVADIARSLARHGARRIYVLNTGVSTVRALEPARRLLAREKILLEYTNLSAAHAGADERVRESAGGTHADEIETSMMLYIAPEIVKMRLARKDFNEDRPGGLTRDPKARRGTYSPTGSWGDPTLATRAKGRVVVEAMVEHVVSFLRRFAAPGYRPRP